jgi:alanyl-tRNA synthetase
MQTLSDVRGTFLDYFARNDHTVVESSPLVPRNDPTLMFTAAGMVQFKNVFTGQETRSYTRATTAQKCVRAGGKHNDLENVGYTARHHTFFEMMGNFSFGDYFKENAIEYAWNLSTREFGLPKDRLYITVYHTDDEAYDLWKRIAGLSDDRIIRIPTADNFWSAGDTGPCGPCSELFYDQGPSVAGGLPGSPDEDGDRYLEFWNLVFMQYDQVNGERLPLPKPSIDTGMGLERMTAILQGKHSNYAISPLRDLIEAAANLTSTDPDGPQSASHRVIADHIRASAFLLADGVMPSNEGRGYVLRRIMRRAMRHAHLLGARDPLLVRLVPVLNRLMGQAYPELIRAEPLITETLRLEETRFKQTLDRGLRLLEDETTRLSAGQKLPGQVAFKLYDTYGFPLDLTQDVLRGQAREVDTAGFEEAMNRQREDARQAWKGSGEAATDRLWFELRERIGATEFLGYETTKAEGIITALVKGGESVGKADSGETIQLLANQTPFYGESGGQTGDTGTITTPGGAKLRVTSTEKKLGVLFLHTGIVESGTLNVGEAIDLSVDSERRDAIRANHSATHLLHEALRRRLGEHVAQKGSYVGPDRLRFDVSQPMGLTADDIAVVERDVNRRIRGNTPVVTRIMGVKDAMEQGAMALFGEKYGEEVRVVSMGGRDAGANKDYSVELCGGTHVARTGDIGLLKIVAESAVAAGIRRIEAVTGEGALAYLDEKLGLLDRAASTLKASPTEVPARIDALMEDRKRLDRDVSDLRRKLAMGDTGGSNEARQVNGIRLVSRVANDVPSKDLKPMADALKKQMPGAVIVLAGGYEGKLSVVVSVADELTGRFNAIDLVRVAAEAAGGKGGGGRPDMAQAGAPDASRANDAVAAVEKFLQAG